MSTNNINLDPKRYLPPLFKQPLWIVLFAGLMLPIGIHAPRFMEGKGFQNEDLVIAIGDSIIPIFVVAAAYALRGLRPRDTSRFYYRHPLVWFGSIAPIAILINYLKGGLENLFVGSPSHLIHTALVPLFAIHVVGVVPHLIFDIEGYKISRAIAFLVLIAYAITFALS